MNLIPRKVRIAAEDEGRKQGVIVEFEGKGNAKHHQMVVRKGDRRRKVAVSVSARTHEENLVHWVRQDIRRLAKELSA